ncbi:NADPH-dependent reductive aminase-like protein [Elsinoe fawcettii]|nr:NADPH-dependent reductive aminase-like protein [Elsinoe fawcettii]
MASLRVGFIGLGYMGTPMALNLSRRFSLIVWNRSAAKCTPLLEVGAKVAQQPRDVVDQSDVVFTMLFDEHAIQSLMDDSFLETLRNKILINTSSVSVEFSHRLSKQVGDAGGRFLEMPVSGSRMPAEQGKLVGLMAGDRALADEVRELTGPITKEALYCGDIGAGLRTKFALNLFLITLTAGLAEAMNFARLQGLDLLVVARAIGAGPMASAYTEIKTEKIVRNDWSPQAGMRDCENSTRLIRSEAERLGCHAPLIDLCGTLYGDAVRSGLGDEDMIAVMKVLAATESPPPAIEQNLDRV